MPTANDPLRALGGMGAKEAGNFWSGTWKYRWHSLLGITRLGRLVAWSGDLGAYNYQELRAHCFCVFYLFARTITHSHMLFKLQRLREPGQFWLRF